mmetsp:Transcript_23807/g.46647  ORF Transcript_23807/g.46647 Transcript_23807/m.46647 type:complete len:379 (+) Transcript_23807:38-1174(+)
MCGGCIGACAASCCCSCVSKTCGWTNARTERFHKIPYTILIFFSLLVALILKNYQGDFGISIYGGISMSACSDACKGDQAVYRITLALTLFFAAHAFLVTLVPYAFAKEIHTACFGVKVLMFIGMVIGMFYMENESLNQFAEACRVISLIFLVFQSIVIIDYAYTLHFWMIDKEQTSWDIANLSLSGLMIASVITVVGLMFHWFADGSSCGLEKFVLSMTIIVPFFYTVAACTDYIPHGALFPSACVTGYATYIAYTAMLSSTNGECNTLIDRSGGASQWELAIGIIIAVASITFTTWNIGSQSSKLFGARGEDEKVGYHRYYQQHVFAMQIRLCFNASDIHIPCSTPIPPNPFPFGLLGEYDRAHPNVRQDIFFSSS